MTFGDWWRESPLSKCRPELYGICEAVWLAALYKDETAFATACLNGKVEKDASGVWHITSTTSSREAGEADQLLRDYYAAYPHGRLGERTRALLGVPYFNVPCRSNSEPSPTE